MLCPAETSWYESEQMKLKRLEKMRSGGTRTKMQLSIPIPKTPDGRVYRY
jgi:hypothetical protein